jgi:hypothetical protein
MAARAEDSAESYALARGVVVAPRLGLIYVLAGDGQPGIEALDARSLQRRVRSSAAVMPLLVTGTRLLALASAGAPLRLAWLDAKTLKLVKVCAPVALDAWVQPSPLDGLGSSFALRAEAVGGGVAYVRFDASAHYVGGVAPTPEQQARAECSASGVIRVTAADGGATLVGDAPAERAPAAYGMEVPYRAGPFQLGELAVEVSMPEQGTAAEVHRFRGKAALPVLRIAAPSELVILSLERSAALAVDAAGSDGGLHGGRVVALATGRTLGRVGLREQVPDRFVLTASRALFVSGDTLISADLASTRRNAQRALRSTAYMGTYPPSAPGAHGF